MNGNKRPFYLLIMLLASWVVHIPNGAQAQIQDIAEAINKAGRQRMLTQRIVKTYCQVLLDVRSAQSQQQLTDAVALYDSQLGELEAFVVNHEVTAAFEEAERLWGPMKVLAQQAPRREAAAALHSQAEEVLGASHAAVLALEQAAGTKKGQLVNLAGRQRMLSQRMAGFYLLQVLGLTGPHFTDGLTQAMGEFAAAQDELLAAAENTQEITRKLKKVKTQFGFFEYSLRNRDGAPIPSLIATAADKILEEMDEIVHLYVKL